MYSADPRVVPEARKLERLDYDTMQEMAAAGARVLNAQAVEFARAAGIVLHAGLAHGAGTGTRVTSERVPVRAVATDAEIRVLSVPSGGLSAVLDWLGERHIPLRLLHTASAAPTLLVVPLQDLHAVEVFDTTMRSFGAQIRPGLGTVSVVGPGVGTDPSLMASTLSEASALDATVAGLVASPLQLTLVTETAHLGALARAVHGVSVKGAATEASPDARA